MSGWSSFYNIYQKCYLACFLAWLDQTGQNVLHYHCIVALWSHLQHERKQAIDDISSAYPPRFHRHVDL